MKYLIWLFIPFTAFAIRYQDDENRKEMEEIEDSDSTEWEGRFPTVEKSEFQKQKQKQRQEKEPPEEDSEEARKKRSL